MIKAKVHANGTDGTGVLFAYGKDHRFILDGELKATGARGVGLSFDFGGNLLGLDAEERGSYWRFLNGKPAQLLPELEGPLAKEVLINGDLVGTQRAIYMSETGLIEKITITPESRVKGDIISEYSRKNSAGEPYLTSLIFGPKDPMDKTEGQKFIYINNIRGQNLDVRFTGSYTALYGGQHELYGAIIESGVTLVGNSSFALASSEGFTNSGTLSPSSAESETSIPGADIETLDTQAHRI